MPRKRGENDVLPIGLRIVNHCRF